jgi:hypothetical protein
MAGLPAAVHGHDSATRPAMVRAFWAAGFPQRAIKVPQRTRPCCVSRGSRQIVNLQSLTVSSLGLVSSFLCFCRMMRPNPPWQATSGEPPSGGNAATVKAPFHLIGYNYSVRHSICQAKSGGVPRGTSLRLGGKTPPRQRRARLLRHLRAQQQSSERPGQGNQLTKLGPYGSNRSLQFDHFTGEWSGDLLC